MTITELLTAFLSHLACVHVERVFTMGRTVRIHARMQASQASCPECGTTSQRVHSRYERRLYDTLIASQEALIHLWARRFLMQLSTAGENWL
ncbi:transposase family protein [Streptosporangium sp. NPDC006013]|uniref:transposase family protein n=1 Tax=Streptosporangium sp. NPDC006013 TaxID=3155596 RepID=UPI00339F180A